MSIKNKSVILLSMLFFIAVIFFLIPAVNYFFCLLLRQQAELKFEFFWLEVTKSSGVNSSVILCMMFPVIEALLITEVIIAMLKKSTLGKLRFGLIISALLFTGFLIIKTFYIAFESAIKSSESQANKALQTLGIDFPLNLFVLILIVFMFFIYANRVTRTIKEYIN